MVRNTDGKVEHETVTRERGAPRTSFLKKHKLTVASHPVEFLEAFFPVNRNPYLKTDDQPHICVAEMQQ